MHRFIIILAALAALSACAIPNGYNPATAAAQDARNEALKATIGPDGLPLSPGALVVQ